jgi:hypothetical protein
MLNGFPAINPQTFSFEHFPIPLFSSPAINSQTKKPSNQRKN